MDIYDIVKELKKISNDIQSDDIKKRISNVIKQLNNLQEDIYNDLNSIDAYSDGDEIGQIVSDLMEKVDYKAYCNDHCDMHDESGNSIFYK